MKKRNEEIMCRAHEIISHILTDNNGSWQFIWYPTFEDEYVKRGIRPGEDDKPDI